MLSSPAAEIELEDDEEDPNTEEDPAHPPQPGSWAAEPSTFSPEKDREDLEHQVLSLTKKLADAKKAAQVAANMSHKHHSQVNKEASENRRALSLSRKHCISRIRELLTEEENPSWTKSP